MFASASVHPIEGGSANDYDHVVGDPVNNLDLDGRYTYSRRWRIGGNRRGAAARLMRAMMANPNRFFPFTAPGKITRGAILNLSGQYKLGRVRVSGVGDTWFAFTTLKGHVEGANANVMFSMYSYKGSLYFQVDASGPNGFVGRLPFANRVRGFIARDTWSHMALNIRSYYGSG